VSPTGPKSYIDILEHITAGGVQVVGRVSEVPESSPESGRGAARAPKSCHRFTDRIPRHKPSSRRHVAIAAVHNQRQR